jgi:hypothetical protein
MNDYGEMFYGTLPPDTQEFRQVLSGIGKMLRDRALAAGERIGQSGQEAIALQNQIFGDPNRPLRVTDEQALARLTDMIMGGPMGFAPAGVIQGASREFIRSSADDLVAQLQKLGFKADVQHTGSRAGPSSYVRVYDPQTGRFFENPFRFSGHGKGPREAAGVSEVSNPETEIPKIIEQALIMREQGPSKMFKKQTIVDQLIEQGANPKQAYKQAEEILSKGLLDNGL